jgi:RNA polymerase sigma-70 factor (ECF subfamily)
VAETFVGRARGARPALIAGEPGLVCAPGGTPRVAFVFTVDDDRIVEIEFVADPERLRDIDMTESDS